MGKPSREFELSIVEEFEDDIYGLWEFDWGLNSRGFSTNFEDRRDLLSSLVRQGLVDVYYGPLRVPLVPALPRDAALATAAREASWAPPDGASGDDVYFLNVTEAGRSLLDVRWGEG